MGTKALLTDLAIALTLLAAGFTGGYVWNQNETIARCKEVLAIDVFQYDAGHLRYIAVGDTLTYNK